MEITEEKIKSEDSYKVLQEIGREFEKAGFEIKRNAKKEELRDKLLEIYRENYSDELASKIVIVPINNIFFKDWATDSICNRNNPLIYESEDEIPDGVKQAIKEEILKVKK